MKKSTGIFWMATWMATLVFAFVAGYFFKPAPSMESVSAIGKKQEFVQEIVAVAPSNQLQKKRVHFTTPQTKHTPLGKKTVLSQLRDLLGDNEFSLDLRSIARAYFLVTELSEVEIIEVLNGLNSRNRQDSSVMPLFILSSRYAELNPVGAIEFVSSIKGEQLKNTAMNAVISTWSKTDPSSAYDWVREQFINNNNPSDVKAENYLSTIFAGLARQDLEDSLSKLAELSDNSEASRMAGMGIANGLSKTEDFIKFYQKSKELKLTNSMNTVMRKWTNDNPEEAAGWLETLEEDESRTEMQETVLNTWLSSEPKQAADWAMRISNEDNRQSNVEKVVSSWVRKSPEATLNWINQQSSIDAESSIRILLRFSVYSDIDFSIDNLNLLESEDDLKETSSFIYSTLKRQDPKKAEIFLSSSPYKSFLTEESDG